MPETTAAATFEFPIELESDKLRLENPVREMFVHSIIFNRHESSLYFWEHLQCKVSAALFATWILETTLASLENRMDLGISSKVETIRKSYEERAIGIVNHCFHYDKIKCRAMLEKKHASWGKISCVDLAMGAKMKSFISQAACQSISKKTWRGEITYWNSRFKIALAIFLPLLMIPSGMIHFRNKSGHFSEPGKNFSDSEPGKNLCLWDSMKKQPKQFWKFYTAPIIVFCMNTLSYMAFLIIFSWVVLHGEDI